MAQDAVEREFADDEGVADVGDDLAGRQENAGCDWQVIGRPGLLEISRGEVDGHFAVWKATARVANRRPHALPALLDSRVGKPHEHHPRLARSDVDLDFDK